MSSLMPLLRNYKAVECRIINRELINNFNRQRLNSEKQGFYIDHLSHTTFNSSRTIVK